MNLTLNPGIKALGVHETASKNQPVKKRITSNSEDWG